MILSTDASIPLTATLNQEAPRKTLRHQIVVIGGGAAGITVTAQLLNRNPGLDIAIIEPSAQHHYQPGWTLVGGGAVSHGGHRSGGKDPDP